MKRQNPVTSFSRGALLLGVLVLTISISPAIDARIYKTVDENGNVVFTDVPPNNGDKAIELKEGSSYAPPTEVSPSLPSTGPAPSGGLQPPPDPNALEPGETVDDYLSEPTIYTSVTITNPEHDQAIRENAGNVTIAVQTVPGLDVAAGHTVQVLLDGQVLATTSSGSVTLPNVDRGTHSVSATIVDANGQVLAAANGITFHLLRHSVLNQRGR